MSATAQNQRLAAARMDEVAATENFGAAVAERRPSISLRSGYIVRSDEPSFVVEDPIPGFDRFQFPYAQQSAASASTEVRVPVYTGGRISNSIESAAAQQTASSWGTSQARLDLLFAVGNAYLAVLRAECEVEASHRRWESLATRAADVDQQVKQGRAMHGDALAANTAAADARQRWTHEQRQLSIARGQYNRMLGRPISFSAHLEEPQLTQLPWDFEQLLHIAYERRPDLQCLLADAQSHELAASSVKGAGRPQVAVLIGTQHEENRFSTPNSLATAAVVMDWNLFNGGKTTRLAGAEQARAASARCLAEDLKGQISVDVLAAWNENAETSEQLQVAAQRRAQATEDLRVTRLRRAQGLALESDVLEADSRSADAYRDEQHARYQQQRAILRLRYLTGLL